MHALVQQVLSLQIPLAHSLAAAQDCPAAFLQVAVASQLLGVLQLSSV